MKENKMVYMVVNGKTINLQKNVLKILSKNYGRDWDFEYIKNILGWFFGEEPANTTDYYLWRIGKGYINMTMDTTNVLDAQVIVEVETLHWMIHTAKKDI